MVELQGTSAQSYQPLSPASSLLTAGLSERSGPARGIILGLAMSVTFWAMLAAFVWA